jgi:hypothetical protein
MADKNKCANEVCSCPPAEGSKYCSVYCEDTRAVTTLSCDCKHLSCAGDRH